jgi:hypothetical protein
MRVACNVLFSIVADTLLCDFTELHNTVKALLGCRVYTHELSSALPEARDVVVLKFPEFDGVRVHDAMIQGSPTNIVEIIKHIYPNIKEYYDVS